MDYSGTMDSECESIDCRGKAAEDQTLHSEEKNWFSTENGGQSDDDDDDDDDGSTAFESQPPAPAAASAAVEGLRSDGETHKQEVMSQRLSSVSSGGSKSKRREEENGVLEGTSGAETSSLVEERTTPFVVFSNLTFGEPQSSAGGGGRGDGGGGLVFHEEAEKEELLIPTANYENSPASPAVGAEENEDLHSIDSIPTINITRSTSAPLDDIAGQKLPRNSLELVEKLSDSLGMAVATVFCEVFERNGELLGTVSSPVDELSGLLGAALKESLFSVLGDDRATFVETFRNSFRITYQTIRSVRRAYAKSGGKLSSSKHPNLNSWKGFQPKSRYVSASPSYRGKVRKNLDFDTNSIDRRKHAMGSSGGIRKKNSVVRNPNYNVESIWEEEVSSFTPTNYGREGQGVDSPWYSAKSNLNESFFTNITREPEGHSDTSGSCSKTCLNESLDSPFFTSSIPRRWGQDGSPQSCSMKTGNESMASALSEPSTPLLRDLQREHPDSDDSWEVDMFSATSSADEWERVDNPPLMRCDACDSMHTTVGPSDDQHRPLRLSDKVGRSVVGDSFQDTKSMRSDNIEDRVRRSSQSGTSPRGSKNTSARGHAESFSNHPGGYTVQTGSSQATSLSQREESGEISSLPAESRMNSQHTAGRSADLSDLFGRLHIQEEGVGESMLVRRRPQWEDGSHLAAPSLGDDLLLENPPVFNYGVTAGRQSLLERYVAAQEAQNHLKSLEITHSMKLLMVKQDHLQLQTESNNLMKENVDLSRSKFDFKEFELEDRKLTQAHQELSQKCADELVAGLCVMLLALAYSAWQFSYQRLSRVVNMCQLEPRPSRRGGWLGTNWMANNLDAVTWHLKALTCEVTKAGRMLLGLILIALVTSALLRRSVASSSQTMPATIIIVVLAGICGFAGKISIDSLGGDGYLWLFFWELLCFTHAFATSCTPWLYSYLYGGSSKFYQARTSSWMKLCSICTRLSFHTCLVLALPLMAGLLPFATLEELSIAFWEFVETGSVISKDYIDV